eukprot:6043782-Pleurochrysis_carterae.AAC.2
MENEDMIFLQLICVRSRQMALIPHPWIRLAGGEVLLHQRHLLLRRLHVDAFHPRAARQLARGAPRGAWLAAVGRSAHRRALWPGARCGGAQGQAGLARGLRQLERPQRAGQAALSPRARRRRRRLRAQPRAPEAQARIYHQPAAAAHCSLEGKPYGARRRLMRQNATTVAEQRSASFSQIRVFPQRMDVYRRRYVSLTGCGLPLRTAQDVEKHLRCKVQPNVIELCTPGALTSKCMGQWSVLRSFLRACTLNHHTRTGVGSSAEQTPCRNAVRSSSVAAADIFGKSIAGSAQHTAETLSRTSTNEISQNSSAQDKAIIVYMERERIHAMWAIDICCARNFHWLLSGLSSRRVPID